MGFSEEGTEDRTPRLVKLERLVKLVKLAERLVKLEISRGWIGDWRLEIGDWRSEISRDWIGDWRSEIGSRVVQRSD